MKQTITFLILLFTSLSSFGQGIGINYTAVIKDDSGNTVASQVINVRFAILSFDDTIVYEEEHLNEMTDANGIINLIIGGGDATLGNYFDIVWGDDFYKLQVSIDIEDDGSYEVFPATSFKSVPYAYHADRASVADNVTGLVALDQGNGRGWRLLDRNSNFYGDIGSSAIDLSLSIDNSSNFGALGVVSFATGQSTLASGYASTALGRQTVASGTDSFAVGFDSTASGSTSTALGFDNTSFGDYSTSMGSNSIAIGDYSTAMGNHTIASTNSSTVLGRFNVSDLDGLFIIGNGTGAGAANRNNALVVRTNGDAQFDGEIQRTSTGSANMVPIAYGSVGDTGNVLGGTGNFTVTYNPGTTSYTISVNNTAITSADSTGIASVNTSTFRTANTTYDGNNMLVHIFLNNGNKVQSPFQFVIYKK